MCVCVCVCVCIPIETIPQDELELSDFDKPPQEENSDVSDLDIG